MAHRKHRRKHRKGNPVLNPVNRRRRGRRQHYRRNPEFQLSTSSMTNLMIDGGVAALGGVSARWTANMFGIDGNMRYLYMLGFSLLGAFILQKLGTGIARPFALGGVAVTALTFAQDKELLEGLGGLGNNGNNELTMEDWQNLEAVKQAINNQSLGFIPQGDEISGFIPQGDEFAGVPVQDEISDIASNSAF